jgi:hypothetical protein
VTVVRDIRAIPIWLLREYLEQAGGTTGDDGAVVGDGWTATLTQLDDAAVGSLRIGVVRLAIGGDADAVARVETALEPRLLRGGG